MIRRRLLNFATALSLLLCMTLIVIWKWSFGDTASSILTTQPWVELDAVDGRLQRLKVERIRVDRQDHWVDNWEFSDQPRKLPDDWGIRFFNDGRFLQFTGDSRLVTSEPALLPVVRSPAFFGIQEQLLPGVSRIRGDFSRHGRVEIQSASFLLFALPFSILPSWMLAGFIVRRSRHAYRQRNGLNPCERCGYNLTANTSGVCPECGTVVPSKPRSIA